MSPLEVRHNTCAFVIIISIINLPNGWRVRETKRKQSGVEISCMKLRVGDPSLQVIYIFKESLYKDPTCRRPKN